ncbi:VOC family protein [Flavihumibacter sp. R14]|nr:VOC family protein [Flavihumibacter soli]
MASIIPIFRIFDYNKALDFYVNWLGFKIDWEDKPDHAPVYLQISLADIVLHLTEHHGDCTPGARAYIDNFDGLKEYHRQILSKEYKYNRPGLETPPWNRDTLCMDVIDPFGNRLSFNGSK